MSVEATAMKPAFPDLQTLTATRTAGQWLTRSKLMGRDGQESRECPKPRCSPTTETVRSTDWDASGTHKSKCSKPMGRDSQESPN